MPSFQEAAELQFKDLVKAAREYIRAAREAELSLPATTTSEIAAWVTRCGQLISMFGTSSSEYYQQYGRALRTRNFYHINRRNYRHLCLIEGAVTALHDDYRRGLLRNLTGTLQTEIFADQLSLAQQWLDQGRKGAAVVLTGAVLQAVLQRLAAQLKLRPPDDRREFDSIAALNEALFQRGAYDKLTHNQVQGWVKTCDAGLNGDADKLSDEQAQMMLQFTQKLCVDQLS